MARPDELDDTLARTGRVDTTADNRTPDPDGQRALEQLAQISRGPNGDALRVEGTLGQGGMAVVRLGTQTALGRKVAVKTLRPEMHFDGAALRLLREAWVTGALEHPNVVPVYDLGLDPSGAPVIVLKRIEGVAWADLLRDPAAVESRFGAGDLLEWNLQILMQVCNAVHFAHSRGIVHRDLKPDNVMIGEFGEVYVLDWGIAVSLRDDGSGRLPLASDAQDLAGTPAYLAPEMLGDGSGLTARTDVYLLGSTLFEILALRPPHDGRTLDAIRTQAYLSDPQIPDDAPPELARICRRAMAADPDARFESALQLRLALQGFLQRRGSSAIASEATRRLDDLTRELARGELDRQHLYNLFGECRFGFEHALRSWAGNEQARGGLKRANEAMVGYELDQGDARAAALLLAAIEDPAPSLVVRVAEAQAARAAAEAQSREHARVAQLHDASVGRRLRRWLSVSLGAIFVALSLGNLWLGGGSQGSRTALLVAPPVMLLVTVLVGVALREWVTQTLVNRSLYATVALCMASQSVLQLVLWHLRIGVAESQIITMFTWAVFGATASLIERRLKIAAIAYLVTFVAAAMQPAYRYYLAALGNALFAVSTLIIWRPRGSDSDCILTDDGS
jgi:serine/threonine-protein kinase